MIRIGRIVPIGVWALALLALPHPARADNFALLYQFTGGDDGEYPEGGLAVDGLGNMYGTTFGALANGTPGKHCAKSCGNVYGILDGGRAVQVTALHSFAAGDKDGAFPTGEVLVQGTTVYGTTEFGTATGCGGLGCGTVYALENNGAGPETVFRFCAQVQCTDGVFPHGGLAAGAGGTLYGTTTFGGRGNGLLCASSLGGCGIVFQLTSHGPKPIYSFCSKVQKNVCTDGAVPFGSLIADEAGNLYGTTQFGGAHSAGTIFKLTPDGTETVLYSFCSQLQHHVCADGSVPEAGLAEYAGNFYGTTTFGGVACNGNPGCGVAFKIGPDGNGYTVLHSFVGGADDGELPEAPLLPDGAGNLYGTTLRGGPGHCQQGRQKDGCGSVFKLSAAGPGDDDILHFFALAAHGPDGSRPEGALVLQNGFLYGATRAKGNSVCKCGTLFSIDVQAPAPAKPWQPHRLPLRSARNAD